MPVIIGGIEASLRRLAAS
ncbi:MAG: hypothetical protein ACLR0U_00235 [Enterocloster clostridioformis]